MDLQCKVKVFFCVQHFIIDTLQQIVELNIANDIYLQFYTQKRRHTLAKRMYFSVVGVFFLFLLVFSAVNIVLDSNGLFNEPYPLNDLNRCMLPFSFQLIDRVEIE